MRCTITGDIQQLANIEISEKEEFVAAAGAMTYASGNVSMDTKVKGGLLKGLRKSASLAVRFRSSGGTGVIGLSGPVPGRIIDLDARVPWIFQRSAYLGSESTVDIDTAYHKKLPSSIFGDEGLVLMEASGPGSVMLSSCGDFYALDLSVRERYTVSAAKALAWESSVDFDISSVGNMKAAMFGSEGLFVITLTGPGKIIIQSSSLGDMAASVGHIGQK